MCGSRTTWSVPGSAPPYIVIPDFQGGQDEHLDISATHTFLPSNVATASTTTGATAAKRENVKEVYMDRAGMFLVDGENQLFTF